jgi:hypothetical protein
MGKTTEKPAASAAGTVFDAADGVNGVKQIHKISIKIKGLVSTNGTLFVARKFQSNPGVKL